MAKAQSADLLEREAELEQISAGLDDVATRAGRLIVLRAPAGMGKSRLLAATGEAARERGLTVLAARGSELEQQFPLGLARQLFDSLLRILDPEERERALSGPAALARPLLGLGAGADPAPPTPSGAGLHALYWLLANVSDKRPLALLVDDAHWADDASLGFLRFLVSRLDEVAIALLIATRPGDRTRGDADVEALVAHSAATRLAPAALSEVAVGSIVRDRLGSAPAGEFVGACRQLTGGNPFYLQELCHALAAAGVAPIAANVAAAGELCPENISRVVLVRVGRASTDAATLARSLAVLGDPGELRLVAALADLPIEAATVAADVLTRADVLADERPLRFVHPIVRSAIAADLTAAERAEAHGRAARLLAEESVPAERVASHLLAAEPLADAWATDQLRAGAHVALERGAPAIAARYLRRALEEPPGAAAAEILRELGVAELSAGDPEVALRHLEQALAEAPDACRRALAARELARAGVGSGDAERALRVLSAARDEVADDDSELATELSAELSGVALLLPGSAASVMEPLLHLADSPGNTASERLLLANLGLWLASRGVRAERCAELATRAVAGGRLLADTRAESAAFHHAVFVLICADRFAEARSHLDDALEATRRWGSVVGFATVSTMRSLLAYRLGRLEEAEGEARAAIDAAHEQGWPALWIGVAFLVDALIERGRLEEAQRALQESRVGEEIAEGSVAAPLLAARGRLRIAAGDLAAGIEDLLEWGRRSDRGDSLTAGTPTFRTFAAPALAALGELEDARCLAAVELELAREWGAARAIGTALHATGLIAAADGDLMQLEAAVAELRETDARLEHARALIDLGAAVRRSGRASDARAPLREGMDMAERCGAAPLASRAQEELAASGVRRRARTLLRGVDALTPSERRIASMAAAGRTNREIAQALFVARKTVEMHLHNAYRKLEIDSRTELADALATVPDDTEPALPR